MKNLVQKIGSVFVLTALMISGTVEASINSEKVSITKSAVVKDNLIGGWEYTVEGAPEGYESGFLLIVKQNGAYKVQVQLSGGAVNGDDVVVKGNNITFNITVEGETVKVDLNAKGSKITGTSTSPTNGTMNITGVKSISPQ